MGAEVAKDCEARKAELECELALARLRREDPGAVAERTRQERERKDRLAREEAERATRETTVSAWRREQADLREKRRAAWSAFWEGRRKARKESREAEGGQSGTMRV